MQKETSIRFALEICQFLFLLNSIFRRFSTSFGLLRLNHRKAKNTRNGVAVSAFEAVNFVWPSLEPGGILDEIVVEAEADNDEEEANDIAAEPPVPEPGDSTEDQSRNRPQVTMSGRSSGKRSFLVGLC